MKKTYESTLSPVAEPAVEVCDDACGGVDPGRVDRVNIRDEENDVHGVDAYGT